MSSYNILCQDRQTKRKANFHARNRRKIGNIEMVVGRWCHPVRIVRGLGGCEVVGGYWQFIVVVILPGNFGYDHC